MPLSGGMERSLSWGDEMMLLSGGLMDILIGWKEYPYQSGKKMGLSGEGAYLGDGG